MKKLFRLMLGSLFILISACTAGTVQAPPAVPQQPIRVIAVISFLADITQQIAGNRIQVDSLIPAGLDPHAYEPTPKDLAKIASSDLLIINGAGLESWIASALKNAGGKGVVIEASRGLTSRPAEKEVESEGKVGADNIDPHFWLDPNLVIQYVANIRDGLIAVDPAGKAEYDKNAEAYIHELKALDEWIRQEVEKIPPSRRIFVTNHESFGYFADRYGFKIIGAIIPSVSTGASPSALHLASLIDQIKLSGAPSIFLETGTNPQLAEQIAKETGVKVIYGLYSHSVPTDGSLPATYVGLMQYNVRAIVDALK